MNGQGWGKIYQIGFRRKNIKKLQKNNNGDIDNSKSVNSNNNNSNNDTIYIMMSILLIIIMIAIFFLQRLSFQFSFNQYFTFVYAKRFAISFIIFFFLSFSFSLVFQKQCTKNFFLNASSRSSLFHSTHAKALSSFFLRRMWYMAGHNLQLIHGNHHSKHLKKDKKQAENWKQVVKGQKIQEPKERKLS